MAVDIKVARKLPNNYVQVDVTPKDLDTRHFKMPADKADSFTASYKQFDSKTRTFSTILMTTMVFLGGFAGIIIPKLLKAPSVIKIIGGIIGALAGDVGATYITAKDMYKNEKAILKANNAEEITVGKTASFLK